MRNGLVGTGGDDPTGDTLVPTLWEAYEAAEKAGYTTAAVKLAEELHRREPDAPFWAYLFARNLLHIGHLSRAESILRGITPEAAERFRDRWQLALASAYRHMGRFGDAEDWFRRAIETAPHDTGPRVFLAGFLASRQRFDEACDLLEGSLGCEGDLDEVYLNLGKSQRALGKFSEARTSFLRALEISGDYPEAQTALADLELTLSLVRKCGLRDGL